MKKVLLVMCVALLSAISAKAQEDSLIIGYCNGEAATTSKVEVSGENWISGAIYLTPQKLTQYAGNKISQIRVALASRVNLDSVTVWVRKTLVGENLAEGTITTREEPKIVRGWNTVDLETPYNIAEGEGLMIGYSYKQRGTTGAMSIVGTGFKNSCYLQRGASVGWKDESKLGILSIEAVVTGNNLPTYDLALTNAEAIYNSKTGSVDMTATVYSCATRDINGFTLTTTFNSTGESFDNDFIDVIRAGEQKTFNFTLQPQAGTLENSNSITVNISKLAEQEDVNPANNTMDASFSYTRNVLVEEFTTENCPNCPRVAGYLHDALSDATYNGKVFPVCLHEMYYDDWLTLKYSVVNGERIETDIYDYRVFYNANGTYAPAMMTNRRAFYTSSTNKPTPVNNPGSAAEIKQVLNYCLKEPAKATITSLTAQYGDNDTTVVINVKGVRAGSTSQPARITVFLTEDNIPAHSQSGATGTFTHQHVLRSTNAIWGDLISWDNNQFDYTVSLGLNTRYHESTDQGSFKEEYRNWNKNNMKIIAFISYYNSMYIEQCYVENVEGIDFSAITGIEDITTTAASEIVSEEAYTLDGIKVNRADMQKGIYILRSTDAAGKTTSRKVVIK